MSDLAHYGAACLGLMADGKYVRKRKEGRLKSAISWNFEG